MFVWSVQIVKLAQERLKNLPQLSLDSWSVQIVKLAQERLKNLPQLSLDSGMQSPPLTAHCVSDMSLMKLSGCVEDSRTKS